MRRKLINCCFSLFICFCFCILTCSCGQDPKVIVPDHDTSINNTSPSPDTSKDKNKPVSTWDNTPVVLVPKASGKKTYSCKVGVIDASNSSDGYIMVNYTGKNDKVKFQLTGPDGVTYTYDLHGDYEVFPLTAGSGKYKAGIFENMSGTQYSTAMSQDIKVKIKDEFGPYLYPNQYVDFSEKTLTVTKAKELASTASSDIEVVENVYNYIIDNFSYDYDKADNVQSGYLPVIDEIYRSNTGICFDYAAIMASMLRSQKIPTRLEVGYIEEAYHAWISTYIQNVGWINGIIEFDGKEWNLMDPTYASTSNSPKNFIAEKDKYLTKYVY